MATAFQNPTKIYALLARDATTGVVIRRGPARHVAFVGWDREHDTFQVSQWLAGRVYSRRCDLSPDGRHLVYFATKKNSGYRDGSPRMWTAVSRAPYMKALAFYPCVDDVAGGGVWLDDAMYWISESTPGSHSTVEESPDLKRADVPSGGLPCRPRDPQFIRAARAGWEFVDELAVVFAPEERREYFGNTVRRGFGIELRKHIQGDWWLHQTCCFPNGAPETGGSSFDRYATVNSTTGKRMDHHFWEWAEVDRDRLVWATAGCLYAGELGSEGVGTRKLLCDFTDMKFQTVEAPY